MKVCEAVVCSRADTFVARLVTSHVKRANKASVEPRFRASAGATNSQRVLRIVQSVGHHCDGSSRRFHAGTRKRNIKLGQSLKDGRHDKMRAAKRQLLVECSECMLVFRPQS